MNNTIKKLAGVAGRLVLAYLLVVAQSTWAGQEQSAKENPEPTQKAAAQSSGEKQSSAAATTKAKTGDAQREESENAAAEEKSSGDGKHEGIKVHGHWTIEVRNPDGSLVTHREFENSLTTGTTSGAASLSLLLSRSVSLGSWTVVLGTSSGLSSPPPCLNSTTGSQTPCLIHEPGTAFLPDNNSVFTLNVSSGSGGTLVLSGTATAGANGGIDLVQTFASLCTNSFAPSSPCSTGAQLPQSGTFTSAMLNSPISVIAGQTIAVTVNISFS